MNVPKYIRYIDRKGRGSYARILGKDELAKQDNCYRVEILPNHKYGQVETGTCCWPSNGLVAITEEEYFAAKIMSS